MVRPAREDSKAEGWKTVFSVAMLLLVLSDEMTERLSILQDDDYI
jgi:hypothetical protein